MRQCLLRFAIISEIKINSNPFPVFCVPYFQCEYQRAVGIMDGALYARAKTCFEAVRLKHVALLVTLASILTLYLTKKGQTFRRLLRRDVIVLRRFLQLKLSLWTIREDTTISVLFRQNVARHPEKTLFFNREHRWTFQQAEEYSNQIANYFSGMGFSSGDTISLVMENRPEHILFWLGLSKIGVVSALINTNLRTKPLAHSIQVTNSKAIIFSTTTSKNLATAIDDLRENIPDLRLFVFGNSAESGILGAVPIQDEILSHSAEPPTFKGSKNDKLMYIFTSGTTGLPKAAIIRQTRYMQIGYSIRHVVRITPDDTIYLYMPFYHAAAGILGSAQCLMQGTTGAVATKFSASRFWKDCIDFNVTVCQYIGEICRYLLAQPVSALEKQHKVRLALGNGLRKDLWHEFQERFNLENIVEFYGSTEGTTSLINIDNTVGAIGFFPLASKFARKLLPFDIIRVDPVTGVPLRRKDGLCIPCKDGEIGEIVAVIRDYDPMTKFDGYADREATEKKIYRDVFRKGDRVFSSKDLVYKDRNGYIYFKDRLGDTFRWKGENVSTTEVEQEVNRVINNSSIACCAYGVEVPGAEGRAGMITLIDTETQVDLNSLLQGLKANLPAYAIPLFVRITGVEDVTGTYKMSKVNFQKQAFDLSSCAPDPVYFLDPAAKRYVLVTEEILDKINNKQMRL